MFLLYRQSSAMSIVSWCDDTSNRSKCPHMNSLPSSLILIVRPSRSSQSISCISCICRSSLIIVRSTVLPLVCPDLAARQSGTMLLLSMQGQNYYFVLLSQGWAAHCMKSSELFCGLYPSQNTNEYPNYFTILCAYFNANAACVPIIAVCFKYPFTTCPLKLPGVAYLVCIIIVGSTSCRYENPSGN